jgi:hypothetical protein
MLGGAGVEVAMKRMMHGTGIAVLLGGCTFQVAAGGGAGYGGGRSSSSSTTGASTTSGASGGCSCAADEVCDTGGRCVTVLAKGQHAPGGIVVDANRVYWIDGSDDDPQGGLLADGAVMTCALGGCKQQPTTMATGQASPSGIALDTANVYWANAGIDGYGTDGSLMQCEVDGCNLAPTVVLAGGIGPTSIAVDAGYAYWTIPANGTGSVWSCPLAGCTQTLVGNTAGLPLGVVASASTLFWTTYSGANGGGLWSCSPGACTPAALVSSASSPPGGFAVDAASAYVMFAAPESSLVACGLGGCDDMPATIASGLGTPGPVASDGVDVYFATGSSVMTCPVSGCNGAPTTIAALSGSSSPGGMALDATYVYWTDANLGMVLRRMR